MGSSSRPGSHSSQEALAGLPARIVRAGGPGGRRRARATAGGADGLPGGLIGWDLWPVADWVALAGRGHPDAALELLARLTPWATGEFAIRPFIDDDPRCVHDRLEHWVGRDDEHVRRLVSEGTRPKLPWAPKLAISAADPAYAVDLLDRWWTIRRTTSGVRSRTT